MLLTEYNQTRGTEAASVWITAIASLCSGTPAPILHQDFAAIAAVLVASISTTSGAVKVVPASGLLLTAPSPVLSTFLFACLKPETRPCWLRSCRRWSR